MITFGVSSSRRWASESIYNLRRKALAPSIAQPIPDLGRRAEPAVPTEFRAVRAVQRIEFPGETPYAGVADEFVRLSCRECAGWRRDGVGFQPTFYLVQIFSRNTAADFEPGCPLIEGKPMAGLPDAWQQSWTKSGDAAQRVAESHGLDVVDVELAGPAKERVLRVFLEKNAEGRARLKAEIAAGVEGLPELAGGRQAERGTAFGRNA